MVRLLSVVLAIFLSSCVYTLGIQQGNVLDQKDVDKLRLNLTKNQVVFVLGNPVVDDSFSDNEWIYLYTFSHGSKSEDTAKRLRLIFSEEKLVAAEGDYDIPAELKLTESN